MARRRSGGLFHGVPDGPKWAWVFIGALVLSMVAFFSGVRMGKAIGDLGSVPKAPSWVKEPPASVPFVSETRPEVKKEVVLLPKETESPKAGGAQPKAIQEERPASPSPPKKISERMAKHAERERPRVAEKKEVPEAPKAKYTLQVAALSHGEEARALVNQLKKKGYPAYQVSGNGPAKRTLYRVRIGQFLTLQDAKQFALNFEKKEKMKTLITSLESQ
jgi:cell division septation protein DedD